MDTIRIHDLETDCIVGILPQERVRMQRVRLHLALRGDTAPSARTGHLALSADYDRVTTEVQAMLRFREYWLIETAVEELAAMLLGLHDFVRETTIMFAKPAALAGRAGASSVEITRAREPGGRRTHATEFGNVETLIETFEAGLYLFTIDPGRTLPANHALAPRSLEWLLHGEVTRGGNKLPLVAPTQTTLAGDYVNAGPDRALLFRCTMPVLEKHGQ